jgi:hypothetical protein
MTWEKSNNMIRTISRARGNKEEAKDRPYQAASSRSYHN